MKKRIFVALVAIVLVLSGVLGLVACNNTDDDKGNKTDKQKLASPANFTFDTATGDYAFDAVENGQFYYIVLVKYDPQGKEYTDIVAMTSMIPGTGRITGNMEIRAFSDATTTPGGIINVTDLPKASYTAKCIATASGYIDSDPAKFDFTLGGKLEIPKVTYTVADGKLNVSLACYYLENALWFNGMPSKIEVYVKNKATGDTLTTLTYTDFSFENKFLAFKTFYIFADTDREYTLPEGLTADDIEITAKAFGNGKEITDSDVAPAYNHEPFKRVIDFSGFGVPADWDAFWTATPEE